MKCSACRDGYLISSLDPLSCVASSTPGVIQSQINPLFAGSCPENCESCISETHCTQCQDTFFLHKDPRGNQVCLDAVEVGYSTDPTNPTNPNVYIPCQVRFCEDCQINAGSCFKCYGGLALEITKFGTEVTERCTLEQSVPGKGYTVMKQPTGKEATQKVYHNCQVEGCVECNEDHISECTRCEDGTGSQNYLKRIFINGGSTVVNSCKALIEDGEGMSLESTSHVKMKLVYACEDENCQDCKNDYKTCVKCYNDGSTRQFYLSLPNQRLRCSDPDTITPASLGTSTTERVCIQANPIPDYYGKIKEETPKIHINMCSQEFCSHCDREDYKKCTQCFLPRYVQYLKDEKTKPICIKDEEIPDKYGKVESTKQSTREVRSCTEEGCLKCRENHQLCTECDLPTGFYHNETTFRCQLCVGDGQWIKAKDCKACHPTCILNFHLILMSIQIAPDYLS